MIFPIRPVWRKSGSDAVHHLEDVFVLEGDVQIEVFGDFCELLVEFVHIGGGVGDVAGHCHDEIVFHDALADVDDIDVGFGHGAADAGDDADLVLAGDGDNAYLPCFTVLFLSH